MFKIEVTPQKPPCKNKTLYLPEYVIKEINQMAQTNNTSFNNVIVSMVRYCLEEQNDENQ